MNTLADFPPENFCINAYCNECNHSAPLDHHTVDPEMPMIALKARLRCGACGSCDVGIRIGWRIPEESA
jgi:hypothetical protein